MSNTRARKPGGGRKPSKPEYSASKNLAQQMKAAADLYTDKMSLQAIADALSLNPIKVRKLLITAGVYESDTAKLVQQTFRSFRSTQNYSTAVTSTMAALQLSRPSVTSYLPYEKGVYFPEDAEAANISAGAERQRHYRAVVALKKNPCEENLWKCVVAFRGYKFKTLSGLPFTYKLKRAGDGVYQGTVDRPQRGQQEPCLELCVAGVSKYWKSWRSCGQTQGAGRYPRRVLHLWDVLPIWLD